MRVGSIIWALRHAIAHSGLDAEAEGRIARDAVDAVEQAASAGMLTPAGRRQALDAVAVVHGLAGAHQAFNAIRDIVISAEYSAMAEAGIQAARDAYDDVLRLFGEPRPAEGDDNAQPHLPRGFA